MTTIDNVATWDELADEAYDLVDELVHILTALERSAPIWSVRLSDGQQWLQDYHRAVAARRVPSE